eukprot:7889202-Pyramimonas_sp.AAC.1
MGIVESSEAQVGDDLCRFGPPYFSISASSSRKSSRDLQKRLDPGAAKVNVKASGGLRDPLRHTAGLGDRSSRRRLWQLERGFASSRFPDQCFRHGPRHLRLAET